MAGTRPLGPNTNPVQQPKLDQSIGRMAKFKQWLSINVGQPLAKALGVDQESIRKSFRGRLSTLKKLVNREIPTTSYGKQTINPNKFVEFIKTRQSIEGIAGTTTVEDQLLQLSKEAKQKVLESGRGGGQGRENRIKEFLKLEQTLQDKKGTSRSRVEAFFTLLNLCSSRY